MKTNEIYCMDCLNFLRNIEDNSVNVVVTSPPYNKGYWSKNRNINNGFHTKSRRIEYTDFNDCMNPNEYINWQKNILNECTRIIKPNGSIFYNHIDILNEHTTIHPSFVYDYPLKQIIIWDRKNTPKLDKSYFFPITEYVFWIKKNIQSRPKFYREKVAQRTNVWSFNYERNNSHPAPFPLALAFNCVAACTDTNDLVVDPFMGSGTTAIAAIKNHCQYIGCDTSEKYIQMANERIQNLELTLF